MSLSKTELWRMGAIELVQAIRSSQASSQEVVAAHLRRIEDVNPSINAVVVVLAEQALDAATAADPTAAAGGDLAPLLGVPFTIRTTSTSPAHRRLREHRRWPTPIPPWTLLGWSGCGLRARYPSAAPTSRLLGWAGCVRASRGVALRQELHDALARATRAESEAEVREIVGAIDEKIREATRRGVPGPSLMLMPLDAERVVRDWRDQRSAGERMSRANADHRA